MVGHTLIIHLDTVRSHSIFSTLVSIISIEIGLHIEQFQFTIRTSRYGKRNLHFLTIGSSRTCISRNRLIVNVNLTLDEPVVCR